MLRRFMRHPLLAVVLLVLSSAPALSETYTAEQANSVMVEQIRTLLGFGGDDGGTPHWLSLSTVGAVVPEGDMSQINDLANFCPDPSPLIQTYNRVRHLNRIYFKLVDWLTGPVRQETPEQKKAREYLTTSTDKKKYDEYQAKWVEAVSLWSTEKDSAKKGQLFSRKLDIEQDWVAYGFRNQVENAYAILTSGVHIFAPAINLRRKKILADFEARGLEPSDNVEIGAFRAPVSEFSPGVDKWAESNGWLKFSFSDKEVHDHYHAETSKKRGFLAHGGFLTFAHKEGGGGTTESKVHEVQEFKYELELKRVSIRRPWLDTEVFFEPSGWTWRRPGVMNDYPRVSVGPDANGVPTEHSNDVFDAQEIGCALLPLEFVLARGRSLTATVSKDDYKRIEEQGSSGTGGGVFGFFGGKSKSWSTTDVKTDNKNTTFTISDPGIAIIGIVSEKLPQLPNPDMGDKWAPEAWLPN